MVPRVRKNATDKMIVSLIVLNIAIDDVMGAHHSNDSTTLEQWQSVDDSKYYDVRYNLYTRSVAGEMYDKQSGGFQHFNKHKRTRVLIHGFAESPNTSYFVSLLKETLLKICDCNVIELDWSEWAAVQNYIEASRSTLPVGRNLGEFLMNIGANLSTTELYGYSLGGHLAGKAGAVTNSRVHRIIAMDPAMPLFSNSPPSFRLDPSDALIVEVIHTCSGLLGIEQPIGMRDFYPNGGHHPQPGCGSLEVTCSHRRAFMYLSEALLTNGRGFKARRCESFTNYSKNNCDGQPFLALANHNTNMELKGSFFLVTNSKSPYGRIG